MTEGADEIRHEEKAGRGAWFLEQEGVRLGAMTYSRTTPTLVIIDSTDISDAARGTGLGRRLVEAAVAWARETGTKLMPLCPFARSVFDRDESLRDVL
jgi:predicted GNAT family acetyltransferase